MNRVLLLSAFALATLVAGCTPPQRCSQFVTLYCQRLIECYPGDTLTQSECELALEYAFPGGCDGVVAIRDDAEMTACLNTISGSSCDEITGSSLPSSCDAQFQF